MDNFNLVLLELLAEVKAQEGAANRPSAPSPREGGGMRRALAAWLVRLGLRLDPVAGEGLDAFGLSLAPEGRRQP